MAGTFSRAAPSSNEIAIVLRQSRGEAPLSRTLVVGAPWVVCMSLLFPRENERHAMFQSIGISITTHFRLDRHLSAVVRSE